MNNDDARTFAADYSKGLPILLLAEDNLFLRDYLVDLLRSFSFAVLVASDGRDAIELSRSFADEITLLITDMEMPRMGGAELADLILRERPGIRVIEMSGEHAQGFAARNRGLPFLAKPFTLTELTEKIRGALATPPTTADAVVQRMLPGIPFSWKQLTYLQ